MGVALEVFLAAEDHLRRRRWSHNEQHRMDVLLKRFEDKVESDLKDAREIWESNQAGEGSSSGAAAKKNRKEKERRARRKREAQASAASALPEMVPTEVGSPEVGEDEEVQGVEANRDSSIDASTNEKGENVKGKGKAVDRQGDDAPEQSGTAAHLEEAVENESLRLSKTETPIEEELPEAASSKSTAKHAILHAQPHNIPNLTLIEPHQPQTQREHQPQLTITSSTPSSTHHKSTIRTSTSTASRPLMTPAIPYNLHLPKKSSAITREATMQEHTSDKQQPESVREMQAPDSQQHPEIEQSQHSDMPQSATSHILPSNSLQPATEHEVEQSLHSDMPHPATSHTLPSNSLQPATEQESHAATPHLPTTEQEPQAETQQLPSTDQQIQPSQAQPSSSTQTRQHLIQFDTYQWLCRNQECRKSTSPYDGSTVICPRCGPYSLVRYCSKKCLFEDLLIHWGAECGEYPLTQKADLLTIERRQINILPALPDLDNINRPERHRQLVRHSLDNTTADYFIFSDWLQWRAEGFPLPWPPTKICSGIVLVPLNFTTAGSSVPNKLFFTRLLRLCFLVPVTRADMTYALFKMIRGRLDELGLATADALNCLTWQFKHEFGFGPGFAELLLDRQQVNWPLVAGEIMALEGQYGGFLSGAAGLGVEWTNEV